MGIKVVYPEKTTPIIYGTFKDGNTPIGVETLVVTIYDGETKQIVNGRDNSAVTVSDYVNGTTGALAFPLTIRDTTITRSSKPNEIVEHVVRLDFTWLAGARSNCEIIPISIKNMEHK